MNYGKDLLLIFASIALITVIGAAVYEHVAVVPQWSAAPPASLAMFQGEYGLNAGAFWRSVHPVALVLLISALIANWRTARRKPLAIVLGAYFTVIVVTAIYFVPELIDITSTPYQDSVDAELKSRAGLWENLSLARLVFIIGVAVLLLSSLLKPVSKTTA